MFALQHWIGKKVRNDMQASPLLGLLRGEGFVRINNILSDDQCAEIVAYLTDKPLHDGCANTQNSSSNSPVEVVSHGIHFPEDVLDCPHIMELVSSEKIVQLAADYLGCKPTLSGLGVQWSFPTNKPSIAQQFHRDSEDWKYLRFLIYLTDVDEGGGPHVYVKGSHRDRLPLRLRFYDFNEILCRHGADNVIKVYGPRGTGIAADTAGIHKGELPTDNARLLLTFTFSILPNPLSQYNPLRTRHPNALVNHTNRLYLR